MTMERIDNLRQQMKLKGNQWLALVPGPNLEYLTGQDFHFMERPFIVFISANESAESVVVLPKFEVGKWTRGAPIASQLFPWEDEEGPDKAMQSAARQLGDISAVLVEHLRMRVLEQSLIQQHLPKIQMERAEDVLSALRMRKGEKEIDELSNAVEVTETALRETISEIRPGVTERALCDRLLVSLLANGGESIPFKPLVQSGPNAAMPHGQTSNRVVQQGEMVLIDVATTVDGYHSDITRTVIVGDEVDVKLREVYGIVRAANAAGQAAVRPGATCQDIDRATRKVIVKAGYGDYFSHRTGHGLGLEVHEDPSVVEGNTLQLEPGMTLTIEPGIYIEGWGGVRIEDDVVVTEQGCESLSTFSRDLQLVGN